MAAGAAPCPRKWNASAPATIRAVRLAATASVVIRREVNRSAGVASSWSSAQACAASVCASTTPAKSVGSLGSVTMPPHAREITRSQVAPQRKRTGRFGVQAEGRDCRDRGERRCGGGAAGAHLSDAAVA
jgi:hypothetical protein